MASANSNDKLIIFKGDDTGGVFGRRLTFTIEAGDGVDLSGCRAEWIFDGIVKTFAAPLIPGEVREVFYSHNETRCMALGVRYGTFRIIDAAGKVRTLTNTKPVEVTNDAARCYPGASAASFVVHGIGDMKHSEFADLEEKEEMTLNEVGSMVNTLIRKLKGSVAAFAALLAFGAFADGAITPDTDFGDISPTAKISTVISDAGAVMTETDPTVPAWAKQATPPQTMTTNTVDALANSAVVTNALTVATTNRVTSLESSKADKSALAAHVANTDNPHAVTAAQVGAVPLVEDASGDKTAVTIGRRVSGVPVGEGSLANGISLNAEGYCSHAEGNSTKAIGKYSHAEGNDSIAMGYFSHAEGYSSQTRDGDHSAFAWNGDITRTTRYTSHGAGTFNINPAGGLNGFYIGEQTLYTILTNKADKSSISATDPTFSNAVLAVGLNIDTNSIAVLNELAENFGGFPLGAGETATTVGGLLAALAAAVAWLRKKKIDKLTVTGMSNEVTANVGVAKLDDFFTESNSLLTGTIDARLPYPLYTVPSTGLLKDRAINTTSLATVTVPDNFTDLLVRASVASSLAVTMPTAITVYGDTFPSAAGEYLVTITKTGAAEAYVRTIKLEAANA